MEGTGAIVPDLRKAVEAIAVKPHAGKLTLLTRKLNNVLMAEAQAQGIGTAIYRIPLSKLCSKADYDSQNTLLVKDQLRKMASTTVEWQVGVRGARRWGVTSLIEVEIIEEGNRCFIEWGYPAKLKEKLLAPDVYARISLQMQNSFRSAAALALYEICVRYVDSPGHLTMRMPWEEWRPTLTGVPDGADTTYTQYKYFKRDVIKTSVAEVNTLTDIEVELIEHKQGRAVADLQFMVRPKTQTTLPLDEPNLFDMSLVARLLALGFTEGQAEKIYSDTDEAKLRSTMDYTEKRLKQAPPVDSPQAYFRKALSAGYGIVPPGQVVGEKLKALEMNKQNKPAVKPQKVTEALAEAWWAEKRNEAREAFAVQMPALQAQQTADFARTGLPDHLNKRWVTEGMKNPMISATFGKWLVRDVPAPTEVELLQFGLVRGLITSTVA